MNNMQKSATILIPDISGFTELFSKTELEFSTGILCELLNELIRVADDDFRVAEIEGDAILFYITGKKLSIDELVRYCLRAYIHFHKYLIKVIARVEDAAAREAAEQLDIKFIAHYGPIAEINISNFFKPVGLPLIQAHYLLKNSIESDAYILITEEFADGQELPEGEASWPESLQWRKGSEEYPVIGTINYYYTLLETSETTRAVNVSKA
ncbi:hypothetical protein D770_03130 [Flammeovirgaceae bacterium 311]|nr:hypothetical protein D770_03130 [Flammeovirgaceae bacterium 311]